MCQTDEGSDWLDDPFMRLFAPGLAVLLLSPGVTFVFIPFLEPEEGK